MPVLILKGSVKACFWEVVSVLRDSLGQPQIIAKTIRGRAMPTVTIILGVGVQSLRKHMTMPMTPKANTATVPTPTPNTKPS